MSEYKQQFNNWFLELNESQQNDIKEVVNGQRGSEIEIVRASAESYLLDNAPTYVDVNGLIPIYSKIAYEVNLLLKGPKGDGKSLSITSFSATEKVPLITVECSEETKKSELIGSFFMKGKNTGFSLGAIPTAIDIANERGKAILVFEELNALPPQIQKQLNALLDFRKFVTIPQIGKTYKLRDGAKLWICATMNPSVYGGTYDLNEDLKSRMEEIEVGYPSFADEKKILKAITNTSIPEKTLDQIIQFAGETRQKASQYALSTRDLSRFIYMVDSFGLDTALQMLVCKFEGEDRDTMIVRINSKFGKLVKKSWGS